MKRKKYSSKIIILIMINQNFSKIRLFVKIRLFKIFYVSQPIVGVAYIIVLFAL